MRKKWEIIFCFLVTLLRFSSLKRAVDIWWDSKLLGKHTSCSLIEVYFVTVHRTTESLQLKRSPEIIHHSMHWAGSATAGCSGLCPDRLWVSQRMWTSKSLLANNLICFVPIHSFSMLLRLEITGFDRKSGILGKLHTFMYVQACTCAKEYGAIESAGTCLSYAYVFVCYINSFCLIQSRWDYPFAQYSILWSFIKRIRHSIIYSNHQWTLLFFFSSCITWTITGSSLG